MTAGTKRRTPRPPAAEPLGAKARLRANYGSVVVLAVFAVIFITLAVSSYSRTSATWDEPIHLTAGYAAGARDDFRIDPSHPPFLRVWAALPTLLMDNVVMDATGIDRVAPASWLQEAYPFAHRFLYVDNDADRLLYRARFMTVILGVVLGVVLFLWAREWLGFVPAVAALALYTLEPNLVSHASLVTTDFGVTCFIFTAVYFAWRLHRHGGWWNVAGLAICCGLAVVSKFSGVFLAPVVAMLLATTVAERSTLTVRRAVMVCAIVALTSFGAIWAAYGFRYLPSASASWTFTLQDSPLAQTAPGVARFGAWLDSTRVLPNAFTQGALYTHLSVKPMPGFLAGEISTAGWWYYFPAAFVMKTPLMLLVLLGAGLVVFARWRGDLGTSNELFVLVPATVFLVLAMISGVNIGVRHILPVYPFVILIAAAGTREVLRLRRPLAGTALLLIATVSVVEFGSAFPYPLTFFNHLFGGPQNGYRYLADSNLGWGHGLKELKAWMDRHAVSHMNLAYFGQADPAYYGIGVTYLPGGPAFAIDKTARPTLPGFVAISSTTLNGVYAPPAWRLFYRPFHDIEPVAVIANSIRVYQIDRWPEAVGASTGGAGPDAHRSLADALLFGLQWPSRAAVHYAEYLRARPEDADTLVSYGMALAADNRGNEALIALRKAVESDDEHGRAQLTLGKALFGTRDLAGAATHGVRAAALLPDDAEAHLFLGRIRAAQGNLTAAAHEFERTVEIQPMHPEAHEYLGRVRRALDAERLGAGRAVRGQ